MLTLNSHVFQAEEVFVSEIDGELVMMSTENGAYYNLDPIGTDVWNRIAEPTEVEGLCRALSAEYDADPDIIRRDVLALLDRMAEKGLIGVRPQDVSPAQPA